jgi:hypothetical protein
VKLRQARVNSRINRMTAMTRAAMAMVRVFISSSDG